MAPRLSGLRIALFRNARLPRRECYPTRRFVRENTVAAHLLIVDALNLIRRIHAVQGSPCVETCQHALDQLIIHSQPTHAVAVFDDDARSSGWRHQRLPDYKAGRPPMPDDLHNEMPALRAAFEQRGVRCWASDGNEADDLAATLALKVTEAGHQATIVSTDKGYCQLLSPGLRIRDYFQKRWLDAPFIEKEFGVTSPAVAGLLGSGRNQQFESPRRCRYRPQKRDPAVGSVSKSGGNLRPSGRGAGKVAQKA